MFKPGEVVINNNSQVFATVHLSDSHITETYFNFTTDFISTNIKNTKTGLIQTKTKFVSQKPSILLTYTDIGNDRYFINRLTTNK